MINTITRNLLLTFIVMLLLSACGSDSKQLTLLDSAEKIMIVAPDSALSQLREIDSQKLNRADNARYALLLSQALDKNFIDVSNDSLINIAVEYYEHKRDNHYKMLALYYQGRVKYNAQDYAMSINALLKSEKIALKLNDNFYLGLIYRNISDIYNMIYWGEGSIEYARKSYECFLKTEHEKHTLYALLNIGISLYNYKNLTESENSIREVITLAKQYNDSSLYYDATKYLGDIYWLKEDYNSAISIYNELLSIDYNLFDATQYTRLSTCYSCLGLYDEALKYAMCAYELDSLSTWGLYLVNNYQHNYKEALSYLQRELKQQNDVLNDISTQNVLQTVENFKRLEEESLNKAHFLERLIIAIIIITIIIISVIIIYGRSKTNKIESERNMLVIQNLQQNLSVKNQMIESLLEENTDLFSMRLNTINELCDIYYQSNSRNAYNNIMEVINKWGQDRELIAEMEKSANKYHENIIMEFRSQYKDLYDYEYTLFLYLVMNFSSRTIATLLQVNIDVFYNRKSKLKRKINTQQSNDKEKFLKYFL